MTGPHIKRVGFYCKQKSRFIFIWHLTSKKSLKTYIKEYIPDVRFIISKTQPPYYDYWKCYHFFKKMWKIERKMSENDFAKYFAKFCNLIKYFVLQIMAIPQNNLFLYYRTNQVSLCCIILPNASLAPQ